MGEDTEDMMNCLQCGKETSNLKFCNRKCRNIWDSNHYSGKNNPFYGRNHSDKSKRAIRAANLQRWTIPSFRQKMLKLLQQNARPKAHNALRGKKRPDVALRNTNIEFIRKVAKTRSRRPTSPELEVLKIIEEHKLPFKYNGDGEILVGTKCPDFVSLNECNSALEIFGRIFHDPKIRPFKRPLANHQTFEGTLQYYKARGWDVCIIWDDEITEELVLERLLH